MCAGIRARVAAIYEPPQGGGRDLVQLQPDPKEPLLQRLASRLGLRRLGWIFTDLLPDDVAAGTVKHIRSDLRRCPTHPSGGSAADRLIC